MFWRFGERPREGGDPPLLYDELCHCIRKGDRPWVRLPHEPALLLKLLLRMHARGRTVTPREICAFLKLPETTPISGHVAELRKKIAECGGDPKLIEVIAAETGYRLAASADAAVMTQADELQLIDTMLAHPEVMPSVRLQLKQIYATLVLIAAVAIGFTTWALLSPDDDGVPIARLDLEQAPMRRRLVPAPGARAFVSPAGGGSLDETAAGYEAMLRRDPNTDAPAEACFELKAELALHDHDVLAVDLALLPPTAATRIAIGVEQVPPQRIGSTAFDVAPGAVSTLRVPATSIAPELRAHGRTICIGEDKDVTGSHSGVVVIRVRAVRVE